jgi:S-adenosylmethionine:tRNA ribosyltransferase-isomerase
VFDRATTTVTDEQFQHLPDLLKPGDLLILNNSRVLPARLFARRAGLTTQANSPAPSGMIEVLLTEEVEGAEGGNTWRVLVKPARKVPRGERLQFLVPGHGDSELTAEVVGTGEYGERMLQFSAVEDFYGELGRIGHMPLPPYIARDQAAVPDTAEDRERYQTVYGREPGSAAAPTAGLHFTPEVLARLEARGIEIQYVTLHVGLGTFQPVRVDRIEDIRLHSERYSLPAETAAALNRARADGRRVIAVGTTTTRTLEHIGQLVGTSEIEAHSGSTSIFIAPGHRFRVVSGLLTNFHLPESTLLMLVCAFTEEAEGRGREKVLNAYQYAIRARYRFYSYGDCMLLM